MKIRDVIKMIEADGWYFHEQVGSHRHFRHPSKAGKVTVPGHAGKDVKLGTLYSILRQAGLK